MSASHVPGQSWRSIPLDAGGEHDGGAGGRTGHAGGDHDAAAGDELLVNVADRLRATTGVIAVDPVTADVLRVWRDGREPQIVGLSALRTETADLTTADRNEALDRFVRGVRCLLDGPTDWPDARPRLLPVVRTVGFAAAAGRHAAVRWDLLPRLVGAAAVDHPDAIPCVTAEDLAHWGVSSEVVAAHALANLEALAVELVPLDETVPAWAVVTPDGCASSWLTRPLALLRATGTSRVVAVAPSRDQLLVVGSDDPDLLTDVLTRAIDEYQLAPRPLSPVPYVIDAEGVRPWRPHRLHPCAELVRTAAVLLDADEYEVQRQRVQDLFDRAGEDVYVAKLLLAEMDDGVATYTTWAEPMVDALLPRADRLIMVSEHEQFDVPFAAAVALAGPALAVEDGWGLERYRVTGWPAPDVVDQLRSYARSA